MGRQPHPAGQAWQPPCQTCFPDPSQLEVPSDPPVSHGCLDLVLSVRARICAAWRLVARQVAGAGELKVWGCCSTVLAACPSSSSRKGRLLQTPGAGWLEQDWPSPNVCVYGGGDTFRDLANFGLGQEGDEARAVTDGEI